MKKLVTIGFFCFSTLTILAQSELSIQNSEKVIGTNSRTNEKILAKEYIFPERIDQYQLDSVSGFVAVQLRGTSKNGKWLNNSGNIVLFDLRANKIRWAKKINYSQSSIKQFGHLLIQKINDKSYCLNVGNGEVMWEVKNSISYFERGRNLGIGYKSNNLTGSTNTLEGIDLLNGNNIWKREISREYSWNDIFHLNDSVLIVAAAGLHSINLTDGIGWDYHTITGAKDYKSTIATNVAGAALGVLTGSYLMSTGSDLVRDVVSNVLIDSSNIYFASRENIARLDQRGNVKWSFSFPKGLASNSSIFMKDSLIYMVNKGFAFMGNRQIDFGTPFLAAYNKNTGKQHFFNTLNDKKDQIGGFKIIKDEIILILKDRVLKYSLVNGSLVLEKSFDMGLVGELSYFIGDQAYLKRDNSFVCLVTSDSTSHYLYTKTGKILKLNSQFDLAEQLDYKQLYICYLKTKDIRFLAKDQGTTVIGRDNQNHAELKITGNAILKGSKLYDIQEKSFIELELKELE